MSISSTAFEPVAFFKSDPTIPACVKDFFRGGLAFFDVSILLWPVMGEFILLAFICKARLLFDLIMPIASAAEPLVSCSARSIKLFLASLSHQNSHVRESRERQDTRGTLRPDSRVPRGFGFSFKPATL